MASSEQVSQRLKSFFNQEQPGVIAIKGAWGVGKSYLWCNYIEEWVQREEYIKGCRGYSQVSLFSISNISELKRSIYARKRPLGPPRVHLEASIQSLLSNMLRWVQHSGDLFRGFGLRNTELWAEIVEDKGLRNMLVCLDDLERKDPSVTPAALLGFITNLRDERRCKVVLLYNANKAENDENFGPALAEYREKVIDTEIELSPSVRECFDLVFKDPLYHFAGKDRNLPYDFEVIDTRSLVQIFELVGLANIRVMQKIRTILDYIAPSVATRYPRAWPQVARQTVKLSWLHYCHGKDFPIEDVLNHQQMMMVKFAQKDGPKENLDTPGKYDPVTKIRYHAAACDALIVEYLLQGTVVFEKHEAQLAKLEAERNRNEIDSKYSAVWDLAYDNFQSSEAEVYSAAKELIHAHLSDLTLVELHNLVEFMGKFGPNAQEQLLLEAKTNEFVRANAEIEPMQLDLHVFPRELAQGIRQRLSALTLQKPIMEVVEMVAGNSGGWNPSDLRFLKGYSTSDYFEWLKREKNPRLRILLREFRNRCGQEPGPEILAKLDAALLQMAVRSPLDARRVHDGIKVPKPSEGARA